MKTFLIYLQLWIWNFAHFFSYKKIKKRRCFFIHPSLLSATRALRRPGDATSFWGWRRGDMTLRACMSMTTSSTREFRNNTASIGTITKKTGFSRPIMRLLAQKFFFYEVIFLCLLIKVNSSLIYRLIEAKNHWTLTLV